MPLIERYDAVSEAAGNASSYASDLNVAIQNEAFGDIFDNEAPIRVPIDPNEKVIVDDDEILGELLRYSEHETPYGRNIDEVNARVAQQFEVQ